MLNSPAYFASGDISPSRFVFISNDFRVQQSGANGRIVGISQEGTRRYPSTIQSADDGLAAKSGESVTVYGMGHSNIYLELGGTVAAGAYCKSDSLGRGVTSTGASADSLGAMALEAGVSGDKIRVYVLLNPARS